MAIKGNIGNYVIDIPTTELVIFQVPNAAERAVIGAMSLHNTTVNKIIVQIYESSDTTIASGKRIGHYTLGANQEIDVNTVIGQGYSTTNLVAIADLDGCNVKSSFTQYTGGS